MRDEEEMFKKVFGESTEEALRETNESGDAARVRKVEAAPSKKEVKSTIRTTQYSGVGARTV